MYLHPSALLMSNPYYCKSTIVCERKYAILENLASQLIYVTFVYAFNVKHSQLTDYRCMIPYSTGSMYTSYAITSLQL